MRKFTEQEIERGYWLKCVSGEDEYIKEFLTQCRILEMRENPAEYHYSLGHFEYVSPLDQIIERKIESLLKEDTMGFVMVKNSYISLKLENLTTKKHYIFDMYLQMFLYEVIYIDKNRGD